MTQRLNLEYVLTIKSYRPTSLCDSLVHHMKPMQREPVCSRELFIRLTNRRFFLYRILHIKWCVTCPSLRKLDDITIVTSSILPSDGDGWKQESHPSPLLCKLDGGDGLDSFCPPSPIIPVPPPRGSGGEGGMASR